MRTAQGLVLAALLLAPAAARAGGTPAMRSGAALALPLDVFNHRLFDVQMRKLGKSFGFLGYRYELWPVHLLDSDNMPLAEMEELRALPLMRPARGYELRVF